VEFSPGNNQKNDLANRQVFLMADGSKMDPK